MNQYLDYIMEQLEKLMAIDSPSGFTKKVTDYKRTFTSVSCRRI